MTSTSGVSSGAAPPSSQSMPKSRHGSTEVKGESGIDRRHQRGGGRKETGWRSKVQGEEGTVRIMETRDEIDTETQRETPTNRSAEARQVDFRRATGSNRQELHRHGDLQAAMRPSQEP